MTESLLILLACLFLISATYSSVGHAGASGYLAFFVLWAFSPDEIKPTSLVLNLVVSAIGAFRFIREGHFDKKTFIAFSVLSIPMALLGGYLNIGDKPFKVIATFFLLFSAIYIFIRHILNWDIRRTKNEDNNTSNLWMYPTGGIIGFVSGLIGVGGGIFLSPVLYLFSSLPVRTISGISALFIFVNSLLGLIGHMSHNGSLPSDLGWFILAVIPGGLFGSWLGTKKLSSSIIYSILCFILASAGIKMLMSL
jgi:uncharacterized membrane protein YfcA